MDGDGWITIAVDGMDQQKTNIPRFAVEDKNTKNLPRINTHLTGMNI